LIALTTLVSSSDFQNVLTDNLDVDEFWDYGGDEARESFRPAELVDIRWVPWSGIGLLIETSNLRRKISHFVISSGPPPTSLLSS